VRRGRLERQSRQRLLTYRLSRSAGHSHGSGVSRRGCARTLDGGPVRRLSDTHLTRTIRRA